MESLWVVADCITVVLEVEVEDTHTAMVAVVD
jgi:hypothetical protein